MGVDSTPAADAAGRSGGADAGRNTTHDPLASVESNRGGVPPASDRATGWQHRAQAHDRPAAPDRGQAASDKARPLPIDFAAVSNFASTDGSRVTAGRLQLPDNGRYVYGLPRVEGTNAEPAAFDGIPKRSQVVLGGPATDAGLVLVIGSLAAHHPLEIGHRTRLGRDGMSMFTLDRPQPLKEGTGHRPSGDTTTVLMTPESPVLRGDPTRSASVDQTRTGVAWPARAEKAVAAVDLTWSEDRREQESKAQKGEFEGYARLVKGITTTPARMTEVVAQLFGRIAVVAAFNLRGEPGRSISGTIDRRMEANDPVFVLTRVPRSFDPWLPGLAKGRWHEAVLDNRGHPRLINPSGRYSDPVSASDLAKLIQPFYVTTRR